MPTENRSSNTEMVSAAPAPKRNRIYVEVRECEGCNHIGIDDAHSTLGACHECEWSGPEPVEDKCPGCGRENVIAAACPDCASRYVLAASKEFDVPPPHPHPEPIAWMVGTAIWWTKEEAERDAAATGLPIVGLGPMAGVAPVEQHQGKPVGEVVAFGKGLHEIAWAAGRMPKLGAKLYTHADPGEVERLRNELDEWKKRCQYNADTAHDVAHERDTLRAEADRLRQEVASIDKKLRGNVSDPDPLKPIMPGDLSITTTYGLVAGIVRERDQLKKALERQP